MKLKITIEIDTDSGDYDIVYNNLSEPGGVIDYNLAQRSTYAVLRDVHRQQGGDGDSWGPVKGGA